MAPTHETATADGSEDVNDFLVRIRELGNKRDKEDEERTRKLEEEILQGRRERQARRAERARSISPTKDSPLQLQLNELIQQDPHPSTPLSHSIRPPIDLIPSSSASREHTGLPARDTEARHTETPPKEPSPDMINKSPVLGPPLSWKQHPTSRDLGSPTPLAPKVAATKENPAVDMSDDTISVSRTEIAASLGSKDPSFFRQTSDRGEGSRAYRRAHNSSFSETTMDRPNVRLPGLNREVVSDLGVSSASDLGDEISRSPSRTSSAYGTSSFGNRYSSISSVSTAGLGSPVPLSSPRRHERTLSTYEEKQQQPGEILTMSPAQGRIASERPVSPTKGLGGFVQSAMLKRSDSVSKRWSAQVSTNTLRGNVSRPLPSPGLPIEGLSGPPISRPNSRLDSRPGSSHSEATVVRNEDDEVSAANRSTDGHSRPSSRRKESVSTFNAKNSDLPVSPSKTMDPKRWSPTKASWLESALSKPETLKSKPRVPDEPEWKRGLTDRLRKAKTGDAARGEHTGSESSTTPGGNGQQTDEEAPSSPEKSKPEKAAVRLRSEIDKEAKGAYSDTLGAKCPRVNEEMQSKDPVKTPPVPPKSEFLKSEARGATDSPIRLPTPENTLSKPAAPKVKSSQIDFRANLRRRDTIDDGPKKDEPEFKAVFGKLRRAETKNYVAPNELKDNILRGKAGLNITGGPKKTERVDEFKDSILKRKEEMKASGGSIRQEPGLGNIPPPQQMMPEALQMKKNLGRSNSIRSNTGPKSSPAKPLSKSSTIQIPSPEETKENRKPQNSESLQRGVTSPSPPALASTSAPIQVEPAPTNDTTTPIMKGKLGNRFNPMLANLIARGPPAPSKGSSTVQPSQSIDESSPTPEALTHMTKSRAKGPKRRLPKSGSKETTFSTSYAPDSIIEKPFESKATVLKNESHADANSVDMPKAEGFGIETASPALDTVEKMDSDGSLALSPPSTTSFESSAMLDKSSTPTPKRSYTHLDMNKDKPSPPPKSATLSACPKDNKEQLHLDAPELQNTQPPFIPDKKPYVTEVKLATKNNTSVVDATRVRLAEGPSSASTRHGPPPRIPAFLSNTSTNRSRAQSRSTSPTKAPVFAQSSETSQIFSNFFLSKPKVEDKVEIDPQTAMRARSEDLPKLKTHSKKVWEITGDGKKRDLPANQEYILFSESMYLCVHTFEKSAGGATTEVYLWCGSDVGEATTEDTQLFARKVAREHNCKLELLKQGKETRNFIQSLGGVMVTRKGPSSRSDSSALFMLCGRRHMGQMVFDEVEPASNSLCSGFTYILSASNGKLFMWQGLGSTTDEIGCARLISMDIGSRDIEEVVEGQEPGGFFAAFPNLEGAAKLPPPADYWRLKSKHENYHCRLYRIDHELGQWFGASFFTRRGTSSPMSRPNDTVQEIEPFCQRDLDPAHIYILDAFFEIYVIVGERSNARSAEFSSALVFAQEYGILAVSEQDRPFLPRSHVVMNGLPFEGQRAFRNWNDTGADAKPPIVIPLAVAIDAIR